MSNTDRAKSADHMDSRFSVDTCGGASLLSGLKWYCTSTEWTRPGWAISTLLASASKLLNKNWTAKSSRSSPCNKCYLSCQIHPKYQVFVWIFHLWRAVFAIGLWYEAVAWSSTIRPMRSFSIPLWRIGWRLTWKWLKRCFELTRWQPCPKWIHRVELYLD